MVSNKDVLPDGRIDHRTHEPERMGHPAGYVCLDCTENEESLVWWSIPYDKDGIVIPSDWRDMDADELRALCGMEKVVQHYV